MAAVSGYVHSQNTSGWTQIDADDLTMYTDLAPEEGAALARHLIRFRGAIRDFPFPKEQKTRQITPKLELLVFAKRRDFARLMKTRHFAAFTQPGLKSTLLVLGPSDTNESLYRNARHEYAHYHLRSTTTGFPVWFDEGLAVMLEYVEFAADDQVAELDSDALFARYQGEVRARRAPSLGALLGTGRVDQWHAQRLARFYGLMGQLTHFLYFGHQAGGADYRAGLRQYLQRREGELTDVLTVSNAALAGQLEIYRRKSKPEFEVVLAEPEIHVNQLVMSEIERDRVQARAAEEANPKRAVKLYRTIAETSTDNSDAYVDLARAQWIAGDVEAAEDSMTKAASLLAQPSAHYLLQKAVMVNARCELKDLAQCRERWTEASALIRQALEQDPERIDGVYLQGVIDLYRGRPGVAVNYLKAAHQYAPWAPRINYYLGECLRLLGDSTARVYLQSAVAWAGDERWRKVAERSLALLLEPSGE